MYIVGTIIYMLIPTTTTPRDFIDGTIQILSSDATFYSVINELSVSGHNIGDLFQVIIISGLRFLYFLH
ncbi:MAG: hypothetical protein LBB37_05495 [Endomicrobium sp.]|jgi:hypothetical protein|nr:hypothetical protein [Endomicrobium sp.]